MLAQLRRRLEFHVDVATQRNPFAKKRGVNWPGTSLSDDHFDSLLVSRSTYLHCEELSLSSASHAIPNGSISQNSLDRGTRLVPL